MLKCNFTFITSLCPRKSSILWDSICTIRKCDVIKSQFSHNNEANKRTRAAEGYSVAKTTLGSTFLFFFFFFCKLYTYFETFTSLIYVSHSVVSVSNKVVFLWITYSSVPEKTTLLLHSKVSWVKFCLICFWNFYFFFLLFSTWKNWIHRPFLGSTRNPTVLHVWLLYLWDITYDL